MSSRVTPAVVAASYAVVLAVLLFVPVVAREYRKRGELGAGTAILRFAGLLYVLALVVYVLSPLPPVTDDFCAAVGPHPPRWEPLAGLDGIPRPHSWFAFTDLLRTNGAVQQFALNVALFVPLGVLLRRLFRTGLGAVALLGFAISLLVELTQLTGVWFLYPCPFRQFDVDDLIANTAGAIVGRFVAPAVRLFPGQSRGKRPDLPRPVTRSRRCTGMLCDLLLLWWIGTTAVHVVDVAVRSGALRYRWWLDLTAQWCGPAVLLLAVAAVGGGTTLGQRVVLLRTVRRAGDRLGAVTIGYRWLVGVGGLALVQCTLSAVGLSVLWLPVTLGWAAVHGWSVLRTPQHRGTFGRLSGVVDARTLPEERTPDVPRHSEMRPRDARIP